MPIDNRASALKNVNKGYGYELSPNKMRDYGKPTSPVAMRMAATKSGLPMKESPAMMYDKSPMKMDDKSPMKMYDKSPMAMRETPLMKSLVGDLDKDGKMSEYEGKRQAAIEKNMKK